MQKEWRQFESIFFLHTVKPASSNRLKKFNTRKVLHIGFQPRPATHSMNGIRFLQNMTDSHNKTNQVYTKLNDYCRVEVRQWPRREPEELMDQKI